MYRSTLQNLLLSSTEKYSFVSLSTLPTSCATLNVTFTVTFTVFGPLALCSKRNCRKNAKLKRTCARAPRHFIIKCKFLYSLCNTYSYYNFYLNLKLICISTKSVVQQLKVAVTMWSNIFMLLDLKNLTQSFGAYF